MWHAAMSRNNRTAVRHTQSASGLPETLNLEMRLPASRSRQPQRPPFVKNFFLGVFDHEFMYYPEPQTKERHRQFNEWLAPIEKYMSECLAAEPGSIARDDVLAHLRELGVFRARVDERHLGLSLSQTELAKLVEVLSCLPWLGSYVVKNHIAPTHIISTLAADELKDKYLSRIATGQVVPAICLTEPNNGINMCDFNTSAIMSECDTHWILNGEKTFVANGHDSNLLLVFAMSSYHNQPSLCSAQKILSVLLVERDSDGVECKDVRSLVGQWDSPVCTVTFKNAKVPKENLVGEVGCGFDILIDSLAPGNRQIAPQAVGVLRAFARSLMAHILQRKHLDRNLHEYEAVQEVVGKIAARLYAMESMLYMTTGMIDGFENQDCELEKAMTEAYCANACVESVYEGLQTIGVHSYLRERPHIRVLEDALSYTLYDSYNIDAGAYISLLGLQHTGKNLRDHVYRLRNPFHFPGYIMKYVFNKERLKLDVADHLHPSLAVGAEVLEKCLTNLATVTIVLLERHGRQVSERQMKLRRLSELATLTYGLTAVLSRASRAYCIGLKNAEQERHMASSFARLTLSRVEMLATEIKEGECENGDRLCKSVAELMYSEKDYFAEHPLNRTY